MSLLTIMVLLTVMYDSDTFFENEMTGFSRVSQKMVELDPRKGKGLNVAFYHIYTEGSNFNEIIHEQMVHLNLSGVLDRLDQVFYSTIGGNGEDFYIDHPKFHKLAQFDRGQETETLGFLYDYCVKESPHKDSNVMYFHTKGSFHSTKQNDRMRKMLNYYAINTGCIDALENYDTCGARY